MMYVKFVAYFVLDLLINLVCWGVLNYLLPLFADRTGNLPRQLSWFQPHDANLDGCEHNGRVEYRFIQATDWLRDDEGTPKNRAARYLCRVLWLHRNNAYGFSYYVFGAQGPFKLVKQVALTGSQTKDEPSSRYPAQAGFLRVHGINAQGQEYFAIKWIRPWGFGKAHELYIGWKLGDDAKAQLVGRYTPFRSFETTPRQ